MKSKLSIRDIREIGCMADETKNQLDSLYLADGNPPNYKGNFHTDQDEAGALLLKLLDVVDRMEKNTTE